MSRTPTGPWEVTGDRARRQIYTIPVSSPSYNVTYVTVQSRTPTAVVFVASPAYSGVMVAWGCAVWGTGYYYPPYVVRRRLPDLLPALPDLRVCGGVQPVDRRLHAAARWPTGRTAAPARRRATTRRPARTRAARWPTARTARPAPRRRTTRARAPTPRPRQGANAYGSWGSTSVQRGDQWASTQRTTNNATGVTTRTTQSSAGSSARVTGPGGNTSAVGQEQQRRPLRGPRRQRLQEVRQRLAEVRQRQLEQRAAADAGAETAGAGTGQRTGGPGHQRRDDEPGTEGFSGARAGYAAHQHLQRHEGERRLGRQQLSSERVGRRRQAKVGDGLAFARRLISIVF